MIKTHLQSLVNNFKVTVTNDFIEYRDEAAVTYAKDQFTADSLLLEYYLRKRKIMSEPDNKHQDFIIDTPEFRYMVDVKEITTDWFNIHNLKWLQMGVDTHELTHFLFYKTNKSKNRLLISGDKIKFEFLKFERAPSILFKARPSDYSGHYAPIGN
jgi:hypothetical protein